MPLASSNKTRRIKIETLNDPRCWILLPEWVRYVCFLKWVFIWSYQIVNSFESFNDEFAIVKEDQDAYLLS